MQMHAGMMVRRHAGTHVRRHARTHMRMHVHGRSSSDCIPTSMLRMAGKPQPAQRSAALKVSSLSLLLPPSCSSYLPLPAPATLSLPLPPSPCIVLSLSLPDISPALRISPHLTSGRRHPPLVAVAYTTPPQQPHCLRRSGCWCLSTCEEKWEVLLGIRILGAICLCGVSNHQAATAQMHDAFGGREVLCRSEAGRRPGRREIRLAEELQDDESQSSSETMSMPLPGRAMLYRVVSLCRVVSCRVMSQHSVAQPASLAQPSLAQPSVTKRSVAQRDVT